jgi:hypothetical protein
MLNDVNERHHRYRDLLRLVIDM